VAGVGEELAVLVMETVLDETKAVSLVDVVKLVEETVVGLMPRLFSDFRTKTTHIVEYMSTTKLRYSRTRTPFRLSLTLSLL
jgi:hypothetical protein